jgi:prephenate dehydrogenase
MALDEFRQRIDAIDTQLISLLAQRLDVCKEVGVYKQAHGLPTMQPDRVRTVLDRLGARAAGLGLSADFARGLWQSIIDEACRLEDELRTDRQARAGSADTADNGFDVTILGAGRMGSALATILASHGRSVHLIDLSPTTAASGAGVIVGDATQLNGTAIDIIAQSGCVVLALPAIAARDAVTHLAGHLRQGAVLVETLSVKQGPAGWLDILPPDVDYLGINPLFGPELAWRNRPVAVVPYRDGAASAWVVGKLAATGAEIVTLSASAHDREMAQRQVAVHAVLIALGSILTADADAALSILKGPPPYRVLLMTLARLLTGNPEVYAEIQADNPVAADMRHRLVAAIEAVGGSDADVIGIIERLQQRLGGSLAPAAADCARLFAHPLLQR